MKGTEGILLPLLKKKQQLIWLGHVGPVIADEREGLISPLIIFTKPHPWGVAAIETSKMSLFYSGNHSLSPFRPSLTSAQASLSLPLSFSLTKTHFLSLLAQTHSHLWEIDDGASNGGKRGLRNFKGRRTMGAQVRPPWSATVADVLGSWASRGTHGLDLPFSGRPPAVMGTSSFNSSSSS